MTYRILFSDSFFCPVSIATKMLRNWSFLARLSWCSEHWPLEYILECILKIAWCHPLKRWAFDPLICLHNTSMWKNASEKTYVSANSIKESLLWVLKTVSINSLWWFWRKVCYSYFWMCFRGLMPFFWRVTPTFISLKSFFSQFIITLEEISVPFMWKNGYLTPKHIVRRPIILLKCFWGPMPIFWWVMPSFGS